VLFGPLRRSDPERSAGCLLELEATPTAVPAHIPPARAQNPTGEIRARNEGVCRGEVLVEPVRGRRKLMATTRCYGGERAAPMREMSGPSIGAKLGRQAKAARVAFGTSSRELLWGSRRPSAVDDLDGP